MNDEVEGPNQRTRAGVYQQVIADARVHQAGRVEDGPGSDRDSTLVATGFTVLGFFAILLLLAALTGSDYEEQSNASGWIAAVVLGVGFVALTRKAIRSWRDHWRIVDTPTLSLDGLRPGHAELAGTVTSAGGPVTTPVTNIPAAWTRVELTNLSHSTAENSNGQVNYSEDRGSTRLLLDDGRGQVVLDGWHNRFGVCTANFVARLGPDRDRFLVREFTVHHQQPVLIHTDLIPDGAQIRVNGPAALQRSTSPIAYRGDEATVRKHTRKVALSWTFAAFIATTAVGLVELYIGPGGALLLGGRHDAGTGVRNALVILAADIAVAYTVRLNNRLVALYEQSRAAWGNIAVALAARHGTILRIAEAARATYSHERDTFVNVALQRGAGANELTGANDAYELVDAVDRNAQRQLVALVEGHPDLTAVVVDPLLARLAEDENRIAAARRFYNDSVVTHRTAVHTWPGNLLRSFTPDPGDLLMLDGTQAAALGQMQGH